MFTSRRKLTIEWGDCDPAGIVFYPRYFAMFDASTANHFAAIGLPKPKLLQHYNLVGFPMVDTRAVFHAPSSFGDEIEIVTTFASFGRSSFNVEHRLVRGDVLAIEGYEKRVLVKKSPDGAGIAATPFPPELIERFNNDDGQA